MQYTKQINIIQQVLTLVFNTLQIDHFPTLHMDRADCAQTIATWRKFGRNESFSTKCESSKNPCKNFLERISCIVWTSFHETP